MNTKLKIFYYGKNVITLAFLVYLISSCSPSIYRKPISDFKAATEKTRDVYFHQLKITHKSSVDKFVTDRKLIVWLKTTKGEIREWKKETADRIAREKAKPFLEKKSLEIRQRAFAIVTFYSDTLLALASDDDTAELVREINGFGSVVNESLNALMAIEGLEDLSEFIGPFGTAVKVLGKLAEIVSKVLRENAIRESIVKADVMVQEIFKTLGNEARIAQRDALENYQSSLNILKRAIKSNTFASRATKEKAYERYIQTKTMVNELGKQANLRELFEKGRAAHSALVQKAADPSFEDIYERIRTFREDVTTIKEALEG